MTSSDSTVKASAFVRLICRINGHQVYTDKSTHKMHCARCHSPLGQMIIDPRDHFTKL